MSKKKAIHVSPLLASSGGCCGVPLTKAEGWADPGSRQSCFWGWGHHKESVCKLDRVQWWWAAQWVFPGFYKNQQAGECLTLKWTHFTQSCLTNKPCQTFPGLNGLFQKLMSGQDSNQKDTFLDMFLQWTATDDGLSHAPDVLTYEDVPLCLPSFVQCFPNWNILQNWNMNPSISRETSPSSAIQVYETPSWTWPWQPLLLNL